MTRSSVVFPAPFGPSRPVTPGSNESVTSDNATFWPNHFDTARASTVMPAADNARVSMSNPGSPPRR